ADKLGIACLEASGYDPIEFQNLLEILKAAQSQESGGIFSTHPNIADRIAKAKMNLKVAEGSPLPPERSARFKRIVEYW
ncbi:MAG: M48 family metalloprotease, partial [Deltaproteobacteria bacterium]|nr:M48 family metalloprotease [Deltaproteobacteria bacterium]